MLQRFVVAATFVATFAVTSAQSTAPTVVGIQNAADFSANLSPGVLAAVYGTNFGSTASAVTITVGGKQGAVILAAPNTLTVQLPVDAPVGATTLTVALNGMSSNAFPVTLTATSPAIFAQNGLGSGLGLIRTTAGADISITAPAKAGDMLVAYGIGFGPTTPPGQTGVAPTAANMTASAVTATVGGVPAVVTYGGVSPGQVALYQVNFTVPAGLQGSQPLVVSVGGKSSTPVQLALTGITSVVSNASFKSVGTVSPGSIVSVFANGIGSTSQTVGFPATTFQGVSVTFNGIAAPLFHLVGTMGQIDLLVPYELPTSGTINVVLKTPSGSSANFTVNAAPATPGLYFLTDPSMKTRFNVVAQFNGTVWLAMPTSMATALMLPTNCTANSVNPLSLCGQPAAPADYLVLYATGLGAATPKGMAGGAQLMTGQTAPADGSVLYQTVTTPTVTVGGLPAMVLFSGIAPGFTGLYQLDIQVPAGITGDDVPVAVSVGSSASDTRTVSVQIR